MTECISNEMIWGRMSKIEFKVVIFFFMFSHTRALHPLNSFQWLSQTWNLITDNPITSPQRHEWEGKQRIEKIQQDSSKSCVLAIRGGGIDEQKSKNGIVVLSWRIHFEKKEEERQKNETNYCLEIDAKGRQGSISPTFHARLFRTKVLRKA